MMYCRRGAVCQSLNEPVASNGTPRLWHRGARSTPDATPDRVLPCVTHHHRRNTNGKYPCKTLLRLVAVVRPRLAIASRRWRRRCRAIVHHSMVACHNSVLRTMGGARPLFLPLSLSQTPVMCTVPQCCHVVIFNDK